MKNLLITPDNQMWSQVEWKKQKGNKQQQLQHW